MIFRKYFLILLLAHVAGDFYAQTNGMANKKTESIKWVLIHCLCYGAAAAAVTLPVKSWNVVLAAFVMSGSHMVIDLLKYYYTSEVKKRAGEAQLKEQAVFLLDQALHLTSILLITYFFTAEAGNFHIGGFGGRFLQAAGIRGIEFVSWITALLLIHKPVNIAISKILIIYRPEGKDADRRHVNNAGRYIGTVERIIILIFISIGQYAAIGLVLTAKSIARYDKIAKDPEFAEYYLLGTLLSTMAVILVSFLL